MPELSPFCGSWYCPKCDRPRLVHRGDPPSCSVCGHQHYDRVPKQDIAASHKAEMIEWRQGCREARTALGVLAGKLEHISYLLEGNFVVQERAEKARRLARDAHELAVKAAGPTPPTEPA